MNSGYILFGRSALTFPRFRAAFPWLGGDLQTVKNKLSWSEPDFPVERQTRLNFPMDDGTGDALTGVLDRPPGETKLPLLILVHGLTGCEASRNIMTSAAHFVARGFPVLRLNLRGAGPSLEPSVQQYHAGRTEDLATVLKCLPAELTTQGIVLTGVSLGGNAVLKFIGEGSAPKTVIAAASVCAPIDLKVAQMKIMAPRNRLYHRYLINHMKSDALAVTPAMNREDVSRVLSDVHTVYDFDERIVAPNNGFHGANDYYRQCSAKRFIDSIGIPTLMIQAATDPWIPLPMYLDRAWPEDSHKTLIVSQDGGHVGYHGRDNPVPWHNLCISDFFRREAGY